MNRALLNPFVSADLPKGIEEILDQDKATCVAFNRHGNLLAVGTAPGYVTLWDFDTRSVAAKLSTDRDDNLSVSAVSFPAPRNGSLVLVSYAPGTVRLFDTLSQELLSEVVFDVPIVQAIAHPKQTGVVVVIPQNSHPLVVHMRKGVYVVKKELFELVRDPCKVLSAPAKKEQYGCPKASGMLKLPKRPKTAFGNKVFGSVPQASDCIKVSVLCAEDDFDKEGAPKETAGSRKRSPYCVAFTRAGDRILRGGPGGLIRTFALRAAQGKGRDGDEQVPTATCVSVVCVQGRANVRAIVLSRTCEKVLVNSQDRCMRLFLRDQVVTPNEGSELEATKARGEAAVRTIEPLTTFTEIVNKTQCRCACFSSDGDYVLGGMEGTEHKIHIWRTADGHLELTLEGAREGVAQIQWHPLRGVITSVGFRLGQVYVWAKNVTENWSAFATEFSELEANEEYSESETEFDKKEPEDEDEVRQAREVAEAASVDVESCTGGGWFSSDSEQEDTYFYIPAMPRADSKDYPSSLTDDLIRAKLQERQPNTTQAGSDSVIVVGDAVNGESRRKRKRSTERGKSGGAGKRARANKRRRSAGGDSSGAEKFRDETDTNDDTINIPKKSTEVVIVDDDDALGPDKPPRGGQDEVQIVVEDVVVDQGPRSV